MSIYEASKEYIKKNIPLLGHDLVLTEDNITTPLIIIGKNFKQNKRVFERVVFGGGNTEEVLSDCGLLETEEEDVTTEAVSSTP